MLVSVRACVLLYMDQLASPAGSLALLITGMQVVLTASELSFLFDAGPDEDQRKIGAGAPGGRGDQGNPRKSGQTL